MVNDRRLTIGRLAKGQRSSATPPSDPETAYRGFPPKPGYPTLHTIVRTIHTNSGSGLGAAPDRLVK